MTDQNKSTTPTIKDRILSLLLEIEDETTLLEIARSIHKQVLSLNSPKETNPDLSDESDVLQDLEISPEGNSTEVDDNDTEKRLIQIELKDEVWYAVRASDGRSFGLCTRLSKSEIDRQTRVTEPQKSTWEIPTDEARNLKKNGSNQVEYWDERRGNITTRHFYLLEGYEAAMDDWRKYIELAGDAITRGLGLSVAARAAIEKLEAQGYEIVLPNQIATRIDDNS